jgi:crotonobetainyl-CoA:carnitine CoA-transferase CaiB-like acyl-CoA transferase
MMKTMFKGRSRNEWLKRLDDGGVPCGAIRTVAEVCDSERCGREIWLPRCYTKCWHNEGN